MPTDDHNALLTAEELAKRLGLKPATVLLWHRKGFFPGRRLSYKVLRFDWLEVRAAMEECRKPPFDKEGVAR